MEYNTKNSGQIDKKITLKTAKTIGHKTAKEILKGKSKYYGNPLAKVMYYEKEVLDAMHEFAQQPNDADTSNLLLAVCPKCGKRVLHKRGETDPPQAVYVKLECDDCLTTDKDYAMEFYGDYGRLVEDLKTQTWYYSDKEVKEELDLFRRVECPHFYCIHPKICKPNNNCRLNPLYFPEELK